MSAAVDAKQAMKRLAMVVGVTLGVLGLVGQPGSRAAAQNSASLSGTASITVLSSVGTLIVTGLDDLRFGGVSVDNSAQPEPPIAGTVKIDETNGDRIPAGAVKLHGGDFHRAAFTVTGSAGAEYAIILPLEPIPFSVRSKSGSDTTLNVIFLRGFSVNGAAQPIPLPFGIGKIGPDGSDTVFVGGTLEVTTDTKKGSFRGDIEMSVASN